MLKHLKTIIAFSIIPQYFIVRWISNYPNFIETYYSNGIYVYISKLFRFTLGWLPFSFGDFVYTFAIIFMIRWFYKNFKTLKTNPKKWFIDVFSALSIVYLAFHLFWGLNYYRLPLNKSLKLGKDNTEHLAQAYQTLGNLLSKIKDRWDDAENAYELSYKYNRQINYKRGIAITCTSYGKLLIKRKKLI